MHDELRAVFRLAHHLADYGNDRLAVDHRLTDNLRDRLTHDFDRHFGYALDRLIERRAGGDHDIRERFDLLTVLDARMFATVRLAFLETFSPGLPLQRHQLGFEPLAVLLVAGMVDRRQRRCGFDFR